MHGERERERETSIPPAELVERILALVGPCVAKTLARWKKSGLSREDAEQEAAVQILKRLATSAFRTDADLRGWVARIAQRCVSKLAKSSRRRQRRLSENLDLDHVQAQEDVFERVVASELCEQIHHALRRLNTEDRKLVAMLAFQGLSIRRASRRLGVDESSLRERWNRILSQLRLGLLGRTEAKAEALKKIKKCRKNARTHPAQGSEKAYRKGERGG